MIKEQVLEHQENRESTVVVTRNDTFLAQITGHFRKLGNQWWIISGKNELKLELSRITIKSDHFLYEI